jgi:acetyl esterase/lipase
MQLDPSLFDLANADPETLALNVQLERLTLAIADPVEHGVAPLREARAKGRGLFGPVVIGDLGVDRRIPGPDGHALGIRVFVADRIDGVYLYFHGGGWVMGSAAGSDARLEAIARESNVAVVSVEYRLAPEHPYPEPANDAEAGAMWAVEQSKAEFGSDRIVIGGPSAGAHLAATTVARMRDRHGFSGFAGAVYVYGFLDLGLTPSARNFGDRPLVLNTPRCRWFADTYAAGADVTDADVSPLVGDLAGHPPALLVVGTLDPLLDDSLFMASRLEAAGAAADLHVATGAAHGFTSSSIPAADRANAVIQDWIRQRVV